MAPFELTMSARRCVMAAQSSENAQSKSSTRAQKTACAAFARGQCHLLCMSAAVGLGVAGVEGSAPAKARHPRCWGRIRTFHVDFLRSWQKESINDRVVSRVQQVVSANGGPKGRRVRVLVTGVSQWPARFDHAAPDVVSATRCLCRVMSCHVIPLHHGVRGNAQYSARSAPRLLVCAEYAVSNEGCP